MNEKLKKILNFKVIENEVMYDARQLKDIIGIKKGYTAWITSKLKEYDKIIIENKYEKYYHNDLLMCYSYEYKTINSNKARKEYYISYYCLCNIIHSSRKTPKLKPILDIIGNNNMILKNRKEEDFFYALNQTLSPLNIKILNQYKINKYRIDGYIKELNIAIEFDEEHHSYQIKKDDDRQIYIQDTLNCTFVRCHENNSIYYNIGLVLKEIFKKTRGGYHDFRTDKK